jgi:hypothetical protein
LWRISLYVGLLGLLGTWFVAHRASAELSERGMKLGRKLERFAALSGKVTQLEWNGQALSLSTRVVDAPLAQVLDQFVGACSDGNGALAGQLAQQVGVKALPASAIERALVLRDRLNDDAATAVCLAGLGDGGLSGLGARVAAFARSWDASELGQLRYAFMRKAGKGTHVLLVSADGPLVLNELVPWDGHEVSGPDVVPGVRPHGSTRILAAAARGTPHLIDAYRASATPAAAIADYGAQLEAAGYRAVRMPSGYGTPYELHTDDVSFTRGYERGSQMLVATSRPDEGGSVLAVVQIARPAGI